MLSAHWRGQFVKQTRISTQIERVGKGTWGENCGIVWKWRGIFPSFPPRFIFCFCCCCSHLSHTCEVSLSLRLPTHILAAVVVVVITPVTRPLLFVPPLVPLPRMPYTAYWCVRGSPYMKLLPQSLLQHYAMLPMLSNKSRKKDRERERPCAWHINYLNFLPATENCYS